MIVIIIFLIGLSLGNAYETKNTSFENNTFEVRLIIGNLCESTDNVFHIERKPYNSTMESITIKYVFEIRGIEENYSFESEYEKNVKKYTEANTGMYKPPIDGNYTISLKNKNESLSWNINVYCNTTNNTLINTTINNTNNSTNSSTNESNNDADNTGGTNSTGEENETSEVCKFEIYTDKEIYQVGEKIKIYLSTNAESYNISYRIDDLDGKSVKSEYTTKNTNTKSYTFKNIDENEKGYYIIAKIKSKCLNEEKKKLVVVKTKNKKEESELIITNADFNKNYVEVNIEAYRGNTSKKSISIYAQDLENKKRISPITSLILPNKYESMKATINIPLDEDIPFAGTIIINGLDEEEETSISLLKPKTPEIIKSYTRNKYLTKNVTWYVRIKGEGDLTINLTSETNSKTKKVYVEGEKTVEFNLENPSANETIIVSVRQQDLQTTQVNRLELIDNTKEKIEKEEEIKKTKRNEKTSESNQTEKIDNLITGQTIKSESSTRQNKVLPWLLGGVLILTGGLVGVQSLKKRAPSASFIKYKDDMNSDETKRN